MCKCGLKHHKFVHSVCIDVYVLYIFRLLVCRSRRVLYITCSQIIRDHGGATQSTTAPRPALHRAPAGYYHSWGERHTTDSKEKSRTTDIQIQSPNLPHPTRLHPTPLRPTQQLPAPHTRRILVISPRLMPPPGNPNRPH